MHGIHIHAATNPIVQAPGHDLASPVKSKSCHAIKAELHLGEAHTVFPAKLAALQGLLDAANEVPLFS